jgi:hypothetical protein
MDAKNEKMGWWWRTIPSRGASALPPNTCVHTEKVFVWVGLGSSHQVDGETEVCGMPPAMIEALSSTCLEHLGLRFLCIPFCVVVQRVARIAAVEESKKLGSCAGNSHTSQRASPTRSPGPTLCGCQRVQEVTSPVGKKMKKKHNENSCVDLLAIFRK